MVADVVWFGLLSEGLTILDSNGDIHIYNTITLSYDRTIHATPGNYVTLLCNVSKSGIAAGVVSAISPMYRIAVEEDHTLVWEDEDLGSALDGLTDISHVSIEFNSGVKVDCSNVADDNVHFITLGYYNQPSFAPVNLLGELTAINVPSGMRLGAIRLQGAATTVRGGIGFFTSRGFTMGSVFNGDQQHGTAAPVTINLDEELSVLPASQYDYTTVQGNSNESIEGKIVARTALNVANARCDNMKYVIAALDGTDTVPVVFNQNEGYTELLHRSGKVDLSSYVSGAITWRSHELYYHLMIKKAGSNDDGGVATETDFELTSCTLGHNGVVRCDINTTPWPGTGYDELIKYLGGTDCEMEVTGFVLPADSTDYQYVVDADIREFKYVSFNFGDISGLATDKLIKTNGLYEPIINRPLKDGARFEFVGHYPDQSASKGNGDTVGRSDIGKYIDVTATSSITIQAITDTYDSDAVNFGTSCTLFVSSSGATAINEGSFVDTLNRYNFTGDLVQGGVYTVTFRAPGITDIIKIN